MPRAPSPSDSQIISAAAAATPPVEITAAQLQRWRKKRLIRSPGKAGSGSRTPDYSEAEIAAAVELARHIDAAPTLDVAAVAAFNSGIAVPEERIRRALIALVEQPVALVADVDESPTEAAEGVAYELADAPRPSATGKRLKKTAKEHHRDAFHGPNRETFEDPTLAGTDRSRGDRAEERRQFVALSVLSAIAPIFGEPEDIAEPEHLIAGLAGAMPPAAMALLAPDGIDEATGYDFIETASDHFQLTDVADFVATVDLDVLADTAANLQQPTAQEFMGLPANPYDPARLLAPVLVAWMFQTLQQLDPALMEMLAEVDLEGENP